MSMKLSKILFTVTLVMGTLISISSSSWFSAWMGMEINLLSFIPLLFSTLNQRHSESAMKYFIIQASASATLVMAAMLTLTKSMQTNTVSFMMITVALLMKAGAAPVHFWFPGVMEGMSWKNCMLLMTWQKLAPLMLMSYMSSSMALTISATTSGLVGAAGGLNQTLLRKIMAYSSIGHMGWMLAAMLLSEEFWMTYMLIYSMLSITVAHHMSNNNMFHLSQTMQSKKTKTTSFMTSTNLLSLGGLPPFLGFLPKWMVMQMTMKFSTTMTMVLILSALVNLFYYIRISMVPMLMSTQEEKWTMKPKKQKQSLVATTLTSLSVTGMLIIPLAWPKL